LNGNLRETYLGNGVLISVDNDDDIYFRNMLDDFPCVRMETGTVRNLIYFLAERMPWLPQERESGGSPGTAPTVF